MNADRPRANQRGPGWRYIHEQHPVDTDLGFMQRLARAVEKALAAMTSVAATRFGPSRCGREQQIRSGPPGHIALEVRLEERRQDRHDFIDVLRHIVVRRRKDVASSLATSERCFSASAHRRFLPGRAADYIADCFTRAQWSEARANLF